MTLQWHLTFPSYAPPGGLPLLLSRLRREKPDTCLVVFERPNRNKPIVYRTYVNGHHVTNFTDLLQLAYFLSDAKAAMPSIQYYVRSTRKHVYPQSEAAEIKDMLKTEFYLIELRSAHNKKMLFCG